MEGRVARREETCGEVRLRRRRPAAKGGSGRRLEDLRGAARAAPGRRLGDLRAVANGGWGTCGARPGRLWRRLDDLLPAAGRTTQWREVVREELRAGA